MGLSPVAESGATLVVGMDFSLWWLLLLWSVGSWARGFLQLQQVGSAVVAPGLGLSCSMACGIFLSQGLYQSLLHWQARFFTTEPPGKPPETGFDCPHFTAEKTRVSEQLGDLSEITQVINSRVRTGTLLYPCAPPILTQSLSLPSSVRRLQGQGEIQDAEDGDGQKEEDPEGPAKMRLPQCPPSATSGGLIIYR